MNNSDIQIMISSDCNYKEIVVEIYYKKKFVALLNQDEGLDKVTIEFPLDENLDKSMLADTVPLAVFEEALILAKKSLTED